MNKRNVIISLVLSVALIIVSVPGSTVFAEEPGKEYGTENSLENEQGSVRTSESGDEILQISGGSNSWETAMNINVNQSYSDSLASYNVENYYYFSLSAPGELSITFDHGFVDSDGKYWLANIYNTTNRNDALVTWEFRGNETVSITSDSLGVPSGGFFLVIECYNFSSNQYRFTLNYNESPYWEKEFNNTAVTANPVQVNTDIHGSLQFTSDKDYYVFEATKPGRIRISFEHGPIDSDNKYWEMHLYAYENIEDEILFHAFRGNAVTTSYTSYFGVKAGKYIVMINDYYYSSFNYTFNIEYVESNYWEKENNSSFITATEINTNVNISGSLQHDRDEDYYSFSITNSDNISFSFEHDLVDSGDKYWELNLYNYNDMNSRLALYSFVGNKPGIVQTSSLFLVAGKYIIKINDYYYSGGTYTFKVNSSNSEIKVTGVSINPQSSVIEVGGYAQLTANVAPENASNKKVTWKSGDTKVVTVDSNGKIYGVKEGIITVNVTTDDGGYMATANVRVNKASEDETVKVTGIRMNSYPGSITKGVYAQLSVTIIPQNATNKNVTWKSYDTSVITVDSTGWIYGVKKGKTTIIATTDDGGFSAYCTIEVREPVEPENPELPVDEIETRHTLIPGEIRRLSLSNDGKYVYGVKWSIRYQSPGGCISLKNGVVTAKKAGTAEVTASYGSSKVEFYITVDGSAPKGKTVSDGKKTYKLTAPKTVNAKVGEIKKVGIGIPANMKNDRSFLTVKETVNNLTTENLKIKWLGYNNYDRTKATKGFFEIEALDVGTTYVVWTMTDENGKEVSAVTKVIVKKPITELHIAEKESSPLTLNAGEGKRLTVTGTKGNTDSKDLSFSVNGKGVKVSKSGYVVATVPGSEAIVTVKAGKVSDSIRISVPSAEKYLSLNKTSANIKTPKPAAMKNSSVALKLTVPKKKEDQPNVTWSVAGDPEGISVFNGVVSVGSYANPGCYVVVATPEDTSSGYNPVCCELIVK